MHCLKTYVRLKAALMSKPSETQASAVKTKKKKKKKQTESEKTLKNKRIKPKQNIRLLY